MQCLNFLILSRGNFLYCHRGCTTSKHQIILLISHLIVNNFIEYTNTTFVLKSYLGVVAVYWPRYFTRISKFLSYFYKRLTSYVGCVFIFICRRGEGSLWGLRESCETYYPVIKIICFGTETEVHSVRSFFRDISTEENLILSCFAQNIEGLGYLLFILRWSEKKIRGYLGPSIT